MCVCGTILDKWNIKHILVVQYHSRTQNIEPKKGIVGVVGRRCVYLGVRWGVREGEWVQVSNYVCMTRRCWGGRSAVCAVEGWVGDCGGGVENFFFLLV